MLRIILARPGSTEYDEQRRIQGTLSIPLSEQGAQQVAEIVLALSDSKIEAVYSSPCRSAEETAEAIGEAAGVKVKLLEKLKNLNHGLWEGKLIEEVRQKQPKVYRQWQEHPETVCPPDGEMLESARDRVHSALSRILKKHKNGTIALVAPEPLASLIGCYLSGDVLGDLWKVDCECGSWESIDVEPDAVMSVKN